MNLLPVVKHLMLGLAVLVIVVFSHTAVIAATVTYSTTCSFNGGAFSSPNAIVFGSAGNQLSITFTGVTNATANANLSTYVRLGQFQTATTGTGATITPGTTIALRITQTAPTGGTATFSSTVFGVIRQNATTGQISFSVTSVTVGSITYRLVNPVVQLVPPSSNNGITTIQGQISSTSLTGGAAMQRMSWPHEYRVGSADAPPADPQVVPESPSATAVTYSTTCSFNGGAFSSPNAIVFGSAGNQISITFSGVTNSPLSADPTTFASLGQIQTATTGTGATITPGTTFAIRITQTTPSGGTPITLSSTLTGVVGPNSSTALITFSGTSGLTAGIPYFLSSGSPVLVPPSTGNGLISLQAQINLNTRRFDFDGDGKTDLSVFRPGPGEWWYQRSSNGQVPGFQFGASTDRIVPGDYTGDVKTDIAIWRPSNGFWFILRSEDFLFYAFPFGTNGDIPVPGDYDGDGKTDAAVFRPTTVTWIINKSSGGVAFHTFGAIGDKPVVADYDGDGKTDIAIYRPSVGEWWYQRSTDGVVPGFQFGSSTDKPVQGDYTGDGKADIAFWRPSTGFWYVLRSEDFLFYGFPWGLSTDVPAPGDFDGDGKFDASVFRPSDTVWYINRSTAGVFNQQFGLAADKPVPGAFVP